MTKANYIQWIEQQIVKLQEFGGMELEIWAFKQCLKKARQLGEHLNTLSVVGRSEQLVCECEPHSYYEWEKEENKCDKCGKPLVNITSIKNKPITPEMLEAYGFEKNDMGEGEFYYSLRLSDERYCDLALITGDKNGFMEVCLFPYEDFFRVRYEHEMLAMYKGITGNDLVANFA